MPKFSNALKAIRTIQQHSDEEIKDFEDDVNENSNDLFIVKNNELVYKSRMGNKEFTVGKILFEDVRKRVDWTLEIMFNDKLLAKKIEVYLNSLEDEIITDGNNTWLKLSSPLPYRKSLSSFCTGVEKKLKDFAWKEDHWIRPVKDEKEAKRIVKKLKS